MKLDERTIRLISIGASVGANCRACLDTSIALALESREDVQSIEQAISVGIKIRHCATKVDRLAGSPNQAFPVAQDHVSPVCASAEAES